MRRHDWPEKLDAFLSEPDLAFVWGKCDCCLWAANWVLECTGVDPAVEYRDRYTTAQGAYLTLRDKGFATVEKALDSMFESIQPVFAQRGDVVGMLTDDGAMAIGVCAGLQSAFLRINGLEYVPTLHCDAAWRVS